MNSIEALLSSYASGLTEGSGSIAQSAASDGKDVNFSDVLGDIYKLAESTDTEDKQSALSLLTGNVNDISSVMIDSEKAKIALSLTIEIRNKILDAYNQIMNMQV